MKSVTFSHIVMVLASSLAGCFGDFAGVSLDVDGNACETYEYSSGTQTTYCDQQNQHSPFPRH